MKKKHQTMTTQNNNLDFTFAIQTLGCKVNTFEAQAVSSALKAKGLIEVDFKEKADVYLINTCFSLESGRHLLQRIFSEPLNCVEYPNLCS